MALRITVFVLAAAVIMAAGCGGGKNAVPTDEKNTEVRVFEVFGMDCPGCHSGVEKLVNKLPGVVSSQANWEKQQIAIKIRQANEIVDGEIIEAIKKANFTPGERLE